MSALQIYYTSCRKGLSGSSGFQVRTATMGIQPEDQREVVSFSGYYPPRGLNPMVSYEEIQSSFPKSFRFYALKSGHWALTMSSHVGKDYTGRLGNYFAHSLIIEDEKPSMWPIDYYEWSGWKDILTEEENTTDIPPPLEQVDISKIPPSESFSFEELKIFLSEEPGRPNLLKKMLRATFLSPKDSRSIVIRDNHINGLYWIACIQKSFPLACVFKFPFSAYQYNTNNCAVINATTKDTDFLFTPTERDYQYYMFDFTTGNHTNIPDATCDYADIIVEWMSRDYEKLGAFHTFMDNFENYPFSENTLIDATNLFNMLDKPTTLTGDDLNNALNFGMQYVSPKCKNQMVKIWNQIIDSNIKEIKMENIEKLVTLLAEYAGTTDQAEDRQIVYKNWFRMLNRLILEGEYKDRTFVANARKAINSNIGKYKSEFAEIFLSKDNISNIQSKLAKLPVQILSLVYEETFDSMKILQREPIWKQEETKFFVELIKGLVSDDDFSKNLECLLYTVGNDEESLVEICKMSLPNAKKDQPAKSNRQIEIGYSLGKVLNNMGKIGDNIWKSLESAELYDMILGEFRRKIQNELDKEQVYAQYKVYVLENLPKYGKAYEDKILREYFKSISEEKRREMAVSWVLDGEILRFPHDFACKCLDIANGSLMLDTGSGRSKRLASSLETLCEKLKYQPSPNYFALFNLMLEAENGKINFDQLPKDLNKVLEGIRMDEYGNFISSVLKPALLKSASPSHHRTIVKSIFVDRYKKEFMKKYIDAMSELATNDIEEWGALIYATNFWIKILDEDKDETLNNLWYEIRNDYVKILQKFDDETFKQFADSINYNKKKRTNGGEEWLWILRHVRDKSVIGKIKNFLHF